MKTAKFVLRLTKKQYDLMMWAVGGYKEERKDLRPNTERNLDRLYYFIGRQTQKQREHEIKIAENRKRLRNKRRILAKTRSRKV